MTDELTPERLREIARKVQTMPRRQMEGMLLSVADAWEQETKIRDLEWVMAWMDAALFPCAPSSPANVAECLRAEQQEAIVQKCDEIANGLRRR